jgi:glycosidase
MAPVMKEYTSVFDGLLDFEFQRILKRFVARPRTRPADAAVQARLDAHYSGFPAGCSLPSFLDNHDLNRFLFEARGDQARLRQAAHIQFQQAQPPIIYYGTEVGLSQARSIKGNFGDLQARQLMPWDHVDQELLAFYTRLIHERRGCLIEDVRGNTKLATK